MLHPVSFIATVMSCLMLVVTPGIAAEETEAAQDVAQTQEEVDVSLKPHVTLETSMGSIVLELDSEKAPTTVLNFFRYADSGYYEDTVFHRVIPNFMIQGGGFTVDMDQKEEGLLPPIKNEWNNTLKNVRGTIAMARTNDPDSATSQFFLNVTDNAFLDEPRGGAAYCVFGHIVSGTDVMDAIREVECIQHPKYPVGDAVTPKEPVVIKSVGFPDGFDASVVEALIPVWDQRMAAIRDEEQRAMQEAAQARRDALDGLLPEVLKKIEEETGQTIQKTDSGLQYVILREGTGDQTPESTDTVEVHYAGTLLDGTEFDSSYERGQSISFPLNRVIPGWTEGVGLMKVGEKRKLIIPPDLGYGASGAGDQIPPNATLLFDVELIAIK